MDHFNKTLAAHDLQLTRRETTTLQINVGLLCNQTCRHCHLDAGPDRQQENMNQKTAEAVVAYAQRSKFDTIDITGGAPELNPNLPYLIESLSRISSRIMLRSNLSALNNGKNARLMDLISLHQVVIVASFPSLDESQANGQRGGWGFSGKHQSASKIK